MQKVALVQVIYNSRKFIPIVFPKGLNQTLPGLKFYVVVAGNDDGGKEYIQQHYPEVEILDPGYNIGFTTGHNKIFDQVDAEFFQLINPDLVVTENFIEEMLKPFVDPSVGAVSGKILHYDFALNQTTNIIDSTGIVIQRSGRGRDRGQHQVDRGQFDKQLNLIGVSGAAAMYRKSALEDIKYQRDDGRVEYFDEDFHSYWEDVDLSYRLINRGWQIKFAPQAVAYHGRAAAASPGGYKKVWGFIKHHRKINPNIHALSYQNHIFLFIKNSPRWYWQFFVREFFYHIFVLLFEIKTFKVLPDFLKKIPTMFKKRKYIQQHRKVTIGEIEKIFI
jgi:GT2 family glycosyltransferase